MVTGAPVRLQTRRAPFLRNGDGAKGRGSRSMRLRWMTERTLKSHESHRSHPLLTPEFRATPGVLRRFAYSPFRPIADYARATA